MARNASAFDKILYPVQTTDGEGVAHFRHLVPGLYEIVASDGDAASLWDRL